MRACFRAILITLLVAGCGGCILPVPHTRVHVYGVDGQVVSSADYSPITNATVVSLNDPMKVVHSNRKGHFHLPAERRWHGAYLIGPISLSLLPDFDIAHAGRIIRVSAPGYITKDFNITRSTRIDGGNLAEVVGADLKPAPLAIEPVTVTNIPAINTGQRQNDSD